MSAPDTTITDRIHTLQLDLQDARRAKRHHDEQADKAQRRENAIRAELEVLTGPGA